MIYEGLKQIIRSVLQQGLSGQQLMEALIANVNPAKIYASDDMLVTDSYFLFCILQLEKKWSRILNGNTYWIV